MVIFQVEGKTTHFLSGRVLGILSGVRANPTFLSNMAKPLKTPPSPPLVITASPSRKNIYKWGE
jgi:hypothetical protein